MTDDYRKLQDERHDAIMRELKNLRGDVRSTRQDVRSTNGRVAQVSQQQAVLQASLPDRLSERIVTLEERSPGKVSTLVSTVVAGVITAFASWWGKP